MSRSILVLSLLLAPACVPEGPRTASESVTAALDYDAATGGEGTTFFAAPWPSDARLQEDGRPDLTGFPNPESSDLLDTYLTFGQATAQGYGLTSPVYFDLSAPTRLPAWTEQTAATSQNCEGPARILDIDPDSPEFGTCTPVQWFVVPSNSLDPFTDPDMIVVQPLWGFPLLPRTTYAAYLVDLEAPDGFVTGPAALQEALNGSGDLAELYAPFTDVLAANPALATADELAEPGERGFDPRWIASATVFTTHDPTEGMGVAADFVKGDAEYPQWSADEGIVDVPEDDDEFHSDYRMLVGAYVARNFQSGEIPYASEGGDFVFDDGAIVPQALERVPFAIGMPSTGFEQPAAGWPIVLHSHGTGGDEFSHIGAGNFLRPGLLASRRGFLSMGIPQPIHGERWPDGNGIAVDLNSFNFFNPASGSSMFRQGAVDLISQVEFVLRYMTEGGEIAQAMPELQIDPEQIYFLGHSQGGLTGGLALPFDEHIKAFALSGSGGGLPMTVMLREDPVVFRDILATQLGEPIGLTLSEQHPSVALVGWLGELTDPLVYAPYWNRLATRPATSILLFEGIHDEQTPAPTAEALAVSAGLPVARPFREQEPFGLALRGLDAERLPYSGNGAATDGNPVTLGLAQYDADHFVIFRDPNAGNLWADLFFDMHRNGGPGVLGAE